MPNRDTKGADSTKGTSAVCSCSVCSCPIHNGLTLESLSRQVSKLQLEVLRLKTSQAQQPASDPVPSYSSSVLQAEGSAIPNQGPPQSIAQDDVLLGELQRDLAATASSLATQSLDILLGRLEKVEQTLAVLSSPSTSTPGNHQNQQQPKDHQDQQQPRDQKRNKKPESNQPQSACDDNDSLERILLRSKIEAIKRAMIDIELHSPLGTAKPALPDPASTDNDIYIVWCESSNINEYKQGLFKLIKSFQVKEEQERKRLRDLDTRVYENDDSPHRRHLQSKIALLKEVLFKFQPQKAAGEKWPDLPSDAVSMDVDLFLLWCIQTPAYGAFRKTGHSKRSLLTYVTGSYDYEVEAACLLAHLQNKDEEERQHLVERRCIPH
ncbi:hypothetical protein BC939DRAFT_445120 [Gamsiella multidivaricata]|uniref:uncharacterized protein n=1 Tax=Gamsiella multidivaricata TaxID=101098 RepID=UPI00221F1655|nr:uncharacterized protein BC939DRAFT_445120 [Gamsiella multidivaricata]KAG0348466.1 hypothetical protein BGZ54_004606 [Gamsiella multidivaricata]KAI7827405.1 hypothetical protein BC939DRAFT_445120 [Gamsiella multidivaricata]